MAKATKMQDQKNYMARTKKKQTGNSEGSQMTDMSKILATKYDIKHGYYVSPDRMKMLEDYEKEEMIKKL